MSWLHNCGDSSPRLRMTPAVRGFGESNTGILDSCAALRVQNDAGQDGCAEMGSAVGLKEDL